MTTLSIATNRNRLIQTRDKFIADYLRADRPSGIIPARNSKRAWVAAAAEELPAASSLEDIVVGAGIDEDSQEIIVYLDRERSGIFAPPTIGEFSARYVTTGPFRAAVSNAVKDPRRRHRPARPGRSIGPGPTSRIVGTLGALVRFNGTMHVLSAGHVLSDFGTLAPPADIYQPGLLDQADPNNNNVIARLASTSPLNAAAGAQNRVDAGLALVTDGRLVACPFLAPIGRLKAPECIHPRIRLDVRKVGRTTRHRSGRVVDSRATISVEFGNQTYQFVDQIVIEGTSDPFASGGDSGAVVIGTSTRRPVGLLMAVSSDGFGLANRFYDVQKAMGFTLLV
jgi:hypothetical protein